MNARHIDDRPEEGYSPTTTHAEWGAGDPRLRITRDDERTEFALEADVVRIGSAEGNELRLTDTDPVHATITHDERDEYVLTLHGKAKRWFQFGGHLEAADRTLAGAAEREAREESGLVGLSVDPVPVHLDEHVVPFCRPGTGDAARPVHHLDVRFVAVARSGAEPVVSDESLDVRWWDVDTLPNPDLAELVVLSRARFGGA